MADLTTTAQKVATAKEKKEIADKAFKEGKITEALLAYHGSLMYLLGLDKNALQGLGMGSPAPPPEASSSSSSSTSAADAKAKEKTEVDDIIEKIYANMSACHLKNKNWKRAQETADKALAKNDKNYKAMFRKAKALSEQGYLSGQSNCSRISSRRARQTLHWPMPNLHDCVRLTRNGSGQTTKDSRGS